MTDVERETSTAENAAAVEQERNRRSRLLLVTLILLFGLPIYLIVAASLVATLNPPDASAVDAGRRLHWAVELVIYIVLGLIWAWPLKRLVMGLGKRRS